MWTAGCVVAEMQARQPVFRADDPAGMLLRIAAAVGSPPPADVATISESAWSSLAPHSEAHLPVRSAKRGGVGGGAGGWRRRRRRWTVCGGRCGGTSGPCLPWMPPSHPQSLLAGGGLAAGAKR